MKWPAIQNNLAFDIEKTDMRIPIIIYKKIIGIYFYLCWELSLFYIKHNADIKF